ncbi:MAG: YggT family protein, partial [Chloroflexota bacterium]|nr:YggT family protein [Chloroflexota bacterium]
LAAITHASRATLDVAIWAHVAGFVIGAATIRLLPTQAPAGRRRLLPARVGKRSDAPGPARLVSSIADLLALLLGARVVLRFVGAAGVLAPIAALTEPIVNPFELVLPAVRVADHVVEIYTLAAMVAVYVLAGLISQLFLRQ